MSRLATLFNVFASGHGLDKPPGFQIPYPRGFRISYPRERTYFYVSNILMQTGFFPYEAYHGSTCTSLSFVVRCMLAHCMAPRNYVVTLYRDGLPTLLFKYVCLGALRALRHTYGACIMRFVSRACRPCSVPGFSPARGVHLMHDIASQAGKRQILIGIGNR